MSAGINTSRETTSGIDCSILFLAFGLFVAGLFLIQLESKRRSAAFDGVDQAYITKGRQRNLAGELLGQRKQKDLDEEPQPIGVSAQYFPGLYSYSTAVSAAYVAPTIIYKNSKGSGMQICVNSGGNITCVNQ